MVTQPKAAAKQVGDRLLELVRYPWLDSVSDDRTIWVVRDVVGQRRHTARIDLNIELSDGTRMTDPVNRALFEVVVEYVELIRHHQPDLNARTHRERVRRLLVFVYWLNQRGVRSLKDVTHDHLVLFVRDIGFGTEWALGMPQRFLGFLQREVRSRRAQPQRGNGRLDCRAIFRHERIHWLDYPPPGGVCSRIARWFENHPGKLDVQASPEELIERMGWKPKRRVGDYAGRHLKPVQQIWTWRDDFVTDVEAVEVALHGLAGRARGSQPGRYATIPPEVAFAYLRGALQWVVVFAPVFFEGRQRGWNLEKIGKRLASAGLDVVLTHSHRGVRSVPLRANPDRFVRLTAAACFAVIAGLSARRAGEIMDLGAGCTFVDMDGNHWIRVYIQKTLRTYEQMPVPAAVHQAVECLEEISAEARAETGDDSLWQYRSEDFSRCVRLRPVEELNNLSRVF